ncbi:MAG: alpha-L-fucosidase [Labilibaculum sp.]|nr:alpha-L-fucosidase [Labilibaculum sp.]
MNKKKVNILLLLVVLLGALSCQTKNNDNDGKELVENEIENQRLEGLKNWKNMKFGMFIHWGVYSIPAGVWEGKEIEKLGEQIMRHADISVAAYEDIARQFNPVNFDAEEIVKLAKNTGMKYIILTAKHHDGFAMFDSKVTDFDIVDFTPYKKDILKELAEACKKFDMKLGLYYSTPDWHFNGDTQERNPTDGKISVFGKVSKENEDYQVAQLKELLSNYGEIVELFFDMGEPTADQSKRFAETIRTLQPGCLVNGRVMNNQGDFITMPDNHLPETPITDLAWETPGTFYHTWGYKSWVKGDPLPIQIKKQIRNLSKIVCMGGNYLLNIGPKSDGSIVNYEKEVLEGVGAWVAVNKEAIHDTQVNPFKKLNWGYSSVKEEENNLFLHVFDWPENGELQIPGLKNNIVKAYYLKDTTKTPLKISVDGNEKVIAISKDAIDENLSIVVVEYEGELEIENPVIKAVNNNFILNDSAAIKQGKYGMMSYRSILKDDARTWELEVVEEGRYEVEMIYKMKYAEKDFKIEVADKILNFSLKGNAKMKSEKLESIDGNEEIKQGKQGSKIKGKWNTVTIGTISLKKGIQTFNLRSGKEYVFVATIKEFHKKDRKYKGLNIDVAQIKLKKVD